MTPVGVILIALAYGAVHGLLRWAASGTIGIDDATETVYAQILSPGYQTRQPPLYNWLLHLTQGLAGTGVAGFLMLKYALLAVGTGALHAVARRALPDPRAAALAALSLSALYQIGWNAHEGVTHTAALIATTLLAWACFMAMVARPTLPRALAFGAAAGLGMLSKHGFPAALALMAAGALATPSVRARLRPGLLLAAAATAALLYAPYGLWLLTRDGGVLTVADATLRGAEGPGAGVMALRALAMPLLFLSPLAPLLLALRLWGARRPTPPRPDPTQPGPTQPGPTQPGPTQPGPADPDWTAFLGAATAAAVIGLLIATVALNLTMLKERHMHPLFLTTPVWLWAWALRPWGGVQPVRACAGALAGLAALVLVIRAASLMIPSPPFCPGHCRQMKPFEVLGPAVMADGAGAATLVAGDLYVAGNLRRLAPAARIVLPTTESTAPATGEARLACRLVWDRDAARAGDRLLDPAPGDGPTVEFEQSWPHPWKPPGWRVSRFAMRALDPADPRCAID
jgi:hypothetical protein